MADQQPLQKLIGQEGVDTKTILKTLYDQQMKLPKDLSANKNFDRFTALDAELCQARTDMLWERMYSPVRDEIQTNMGALRDAIRKTDDPKDQLRYRNVEAGFKSQLENLNNEDPKLQGQYEENTNQYRRLAHDQKELIADIKKNISTYTPEDIEKILREFSQEVTLFQQNCQDYIKNYRAQQTKLRDLNRSVYNEIPARFKMEAATPSPTADTQPTKPSQS